MSLLFESFMVFYLIEMVVLALVLNWYYREPKKQEKKVWDPWGFWNKE